jgi:phenylacetate-coenzyme A ligase PaaK-like adenylate-forming protein
VRQYRARANSVDNDFVAALPRRELAVIIVSRGSRGANAGTPASGCISSSVATMYACFDPTQATATTIQVACGGLLEPDRLQRVRARRLARLLQTCVTRSPLYRKWLRGFDPASARLQDLPIAHRDRLMRQFDDWVTDSSIRLDELRSFVSRPERIADTYRGRYVVWQSSGTSGEPGIFVQDAAAMAAYDALEAVRGPFMRWAMSLPAGAGLQRNLVLIGATEEHYASTVSAKRLRQLNPWFSQRLHDVSFLQPMPRLRQALEALDPIVIATFPSVALQLAQEHRDGHLDATPQEIWVGGETLSRATREFIECSFGCRVRNSYGSSEFLSIAFECSEGALHLNADWVILEPLDRHGSPVPLDVEGAPCVRIDVAFIDQPWGRR